MLTNIILIAGFAALAFLIWLFSRQKDDKGLLFIQNQINELNRTMDRKIGESSKQMQAQFSESAKIIKDVTHGLTKLDETNKQVVSFADQLQHMQDILQNPKQRGVLGEFFLETVLKDVLPKGVYETQYKFENGEIVDAVVFVKNQIVPIDAKFSLENYNRMVEHRDVNEKKRLEKQFVNDLKLRIKETSKYIRPEEGTTDFAFMFIPSEGIYYDLLSNKVGLVKDQDNSLIQHAAKEHKVIIVSPTTFLAYLQTVLQGLKGMQIEETAKEIIKNVEKLGKHITNHETFMQKLGSSLGTTINHYNRAHKELKSIDKDVLKISDSSSGVKPLVLEKPEEE
jgi:DNA recombination protein RmuC